MKFCFTLFSLLICLPGFAQPFQCSVPQSDESYKAYLKKTASLANNYEQKSGGMRDVALNVMILQYHDGPIVTPELIQDRVDAANLIFAPINLHLSICNIQYVPYPEDYHPLFFEGWDSDLEGQLFDIYGLPGYLNIFYARGLGPYAYYPTPDGRDLILMNHGPASTFVHELGHYFSLLHTHVFNGFPEIPYLTDELVNGSNCATAGDFICDTPADPGLYGRVAPAPACQYIDTVTVDANGELYHPDVDNYMAAAPFHCLGRFTPGQYSRMLYVLEHERAYLKSGVLEVRMDAVPKYLCLDSAPFTLTSNVPGGVFSGEGVAGNVFYPEIAGVGNHVIYYTAPVDAATLETTDAYYQYSNTSHHLTNAWQSFTAGTTGQFSGFAFSMIQTTAQNINYSVYEGTGTTGPLLTQGSFPAGPNIGFDWIKFNFDAPVPMLAGYSYTVQISAPDDFEIAGMTSNTYPGGQSSINHDLSFITYVLPATPNCGNTTSANILVSEPTQTTATVLYPNYCADAPASPVLFSPTGGEVFIDGMPDSLINPANLSTGSHQVEYVYTNGFGCVSNQAFSFNVAQGAEIDLPDHAVLCNADSVYPIVTNPPGGLLLLDGQPYLSNTLLPSQLSVGTHSLSYAIPFQSFPWLDTLDQTNAAQFPPPSFIAGNNDAVWQSFTAGISGFLHTVNLSLYSNSLVPVRYTLFKGEGNTGLIIYTDSTAYGTQSTYVQNFHFPLYQIFLEKDSLYTFQVKYTGAPSSIIPVRFNDPYPRGRSSFSYPGTEIDLGFETHLNRLYDCAPSNVIKTFEISETPFVDLGPDLALAPGQSITLDAGNAGSSYLWSTGETTQQISVSFPLENPQIWVTGTSHLGCASSDTLLVNLINGVEELAATPSLSIWPNPVRNHLEVKSRQGISSIEIVNSIGEIIQHHSFATLNDFRTTVNTASLSAGLYLIRVYGKSGMTTVRFVKQ